MSKTPEPEGRAPLESIMTTSPLEIVCIDFWSAEVPGGKNVDILVVTDHFTKIHSDQVANFESQLIQELLLIAGVKKSRTTTYHPMGNGAVERFNRILGSMIQGATSENKAKMAPDATDIDFRIKLHRPRVNRLCSVLLNVQENP